MTRLALNALGMTVQEINRPAELAGLKLTWRKLLGETRGASFFQSLEWLQTYWQHFGAGQRLRVLVVNAGDETLGILPLVVRSEQTRIGATRVCTYPLADWGSFYGPIGPQPTATLLVALRHLQATPREWDVLDLRWVNRELVDFGRTENALRETGLAPSARVWATSSLVEMSDSWDDYLASRDSQFRRTLRQNERRLVETCGPLEYVRHRPAGAAHGDDDPRWDLYETCQDLAAASWQGSSPDGTTLSHEAVREFLADAHLTAACAGAADINLLYVGNRPAAFAYGYHQAGNVFILRVGYDPAVASHGTGKVLMSRLIRDSHERGDRQIDLGPGSLEYKRYWQTRLAPAYSYSAFAATPRAQLLRLKRAAERWFTTQSA